jgi:hypothetical protein
MLIASLIRLTKLASVGRFSTVAVMSRNTSSSAPICDSARSPPAPRGPRSETKLIPLTVRRS